MTLITTRPQRGHRAEAKKHPTTLRFTPTAWAKLLYLRDAGPTEVGGFGISSAEDLLLVEDLRLVRQCCTRISVKFDDSAVADHFDECVDAGLAPEQFARIWIHTHPGASAEPSRTDEVTFTRVFGGCDWAVMAILAAAGESYARLRFSAGPGGELVIPVDVDFSARFEGSDPAAWAAEHECCVERSSPARSRRPAIRDLAGAVFDAVESPVLRRDPFADVFPDLEDEEFEREYDCDSEF